MDQNSFSFLTIEFIYYLLVISIHIFSSIIMITFLLDIIVKTKYQNQFTADISGLASMIIYNNSASSVSLIYNPSYNITSSIDLSNNSLFPNDYGILFLQTSLRNFHYPLDLTLSWSQLTGLLNRQSLSLFMTPSHPQTQYICLFFMCSSNTVFLSMLPPIEAQSLCQTSSNHQALFWICSFTSLQAIISKMIDKLNTQIRLSSNTFIYIIITSKITGLNSYFLQSLSIMIL